MQRIRVLVVDDHRIFAESLAAALAAEQDVEVTAAGSASAALRCLERAASDGRRFDVVLVDSELAAPAPPTASMNGANGQLTAVTSRAGPSGGAAEGGPATDAPAAPTGPAAPFVPAASAIDTKPGGIPLVGRVHQEHPAVRTVVLA
jgi:CheY-like chemotaxis protein